MIPSITRCALGPLAALALATTLTAAEPGWTQWRGPGRDGCVTAADWPDGLAPERLRKQWRVDLGPSYSGPVLAGDTVIVTETCDKQTEHVRALDRATGQERWHVEWEGSMSVPFFAASNGSWIRATPCVDDGRVFVKRLR